MRSFLRRRSKPGHRPGALLDRPGGEVTLRLLRFDGATLEEPAIAGIEECLDCAKPDGRTVWIHIQGEAGAPLLRQLRDAYHLHPLAVEDVQLGGQRPKVERYPSQLFMVAARLRATSHGVSLEQISLFLGRDYLISFHAGTDDVFAPVREHLHEAHGRIRVGGPDYLAFCLLDVVVDHAFPLLESYGDRLEALEEQIFQRDGGQRLRAMHVIRRDLISLRRVLWQQNEMLRGVLQDEYKIIDEQDRPYFRDCYDHSQRALDLLETYSDLCASLLETHLHMATMRLNDIMKVLTLVTTIFIPLSFIAGVYGMNFDPDASPWNMPELRSRYGYPAALALMALLGAGMLWWFKRNRWF